MNIVKVIKLLSIVAPLAGINTEQVKIVIAILELLSEDAEEKK
jgi:hypothetical protein